LRGGRYRDLKKLNQGFSGLGSPWMRLEKAIPRRTTSSSSPTTKSNSPRALRFRQNSRRDRPVYLLLVPPDERPDERGLNDLEMEGPENDL